MCSPRSIARSLSLSLALSLALTTPRARAQEIPRRAAEARDVWSEPNPGVRYLRRTTTTPAEIYALVVSLDHPGVRLAATPYDSRWSTVADRARQGGLAAAINGGFWDGWQRPSGIAAGGGAPWPTSSVDPEMGFFAIDARGRAVVRAPGEAVSERELASLAEAVSGRPILVREGAVDQAALDTFETANQRQPRTAIGLSADARTAILVVVDGRRRSSRGATLYELARLMVELGSHDALNLDGGGSSAMYVDRAGGVVNVPSRGRWEVALGGGGERARRRPDGSEERFVRGVEREVMNHLGVIAPAPVGVTPTAFASALAGLPPVETPVETERLRREPPEPPPFRLGVWRERLAPALAALLFLSALAVAVRSARARRGGSPRARRAGARVAIRGR